MLDAPNAVEELQNSRKHPTAEKLEAIKDSMKHFGIIFFVGSNMVGFNKI